MSHSVLDLASFSDDVALHTVSSPASTSQVEIDKALTHLQSGAKRFLALTLSERITLAEKMQLGYLDIADESVGMGCAAKGIEIGTPTEAEEWATGPWGPIRQLRLIRETLIDLKRNTDSRLGKLRRTVDDRVSVSAFPTSFVDSQLFMGVHAEVHMQRGITESDVEEMRASFYKEPQHEGRVVCVLGAGNIAAIPAMDVLTKMFNEGKVCLLKMNPVNAYLGPYLEKAFRVAIDSGYLKIIYGGVEESKYATSHALVDEIHITGSDKTHDAIVWGQDSEQQQRNKSEDKKANTKPVTAELGNVSPVMLVPGPYNDRQLRAQAEMLVADLTMNASFLCCSAKILLLPKGWDGSTKFLNYLRELLNKIPPRKAYYPGAFSRWEKFRSSRNDVETIGRRDAVHLPWTIFNDIDLEKDPVCHEEPFCSIISIAYVGDSDPENFLSAAVAAANDKLWGNLVATLIVHPKVQKTRRPVPFFDMAVRKLRYGTVSINAFSGMSFVFGSTPWGAYPGMEAKDIQSGRGFVHNTMMLEGIEKCVMSWPLTMFPKPGYYPTHSRSHKLLRKLVQLEAQQSPLKLPGVVTEALIGSV